MEIIFRITVVYLFVFIGLRLLGKREFSELAPMELISLLLIPEIVSQSLVGQDFSIINGLVGVATIFLLTYAVSALSHVSKRFEAVTSSSPTVLAHHGKLIEENLNRERVSPEELYNQIRRSGLERLDQVRWAVLESDGKISIVADEPS
jgi:uncharacterized membrane protein YcaP (DUF421 family)